jgi:hypothetical protein
MTKSASDSPGAGDHRQGGEGDEPQGALVAAGDLPEAKSESDASAKPIAASVPVLEPATALPNVTTDDLVGILPKSGVSLDKQREDVREFLAKRLIAILAGLLAAGLLLVAFQRVTEVSVDDVRTFFEVVFTPVIALVSAATGFYFGSTTSHPGETDGVSGTDGT